MRNTIQDILNEANNDIRTLEKHKGNTYLRNLMSAAFLVDKKFFLPEGDPPYKESNATPYETSGTFWQICRKIDTFSRKDIKANKREAAFITALESLSPDGAKILLAVKDQDLPRIYRNLTIEKLQEIGYFE